MSHPGPPTPPGATTVFESVNFNFSIEDSSGTNPSLNDSVRDSLVYSEKSGFSRTGHTVVAVFLGVILLFGFLSNFFVLLLFARFQVLRTPFNLILFNISVSDMLVCLFGTTFSFAASLYGRWLVGDQGCKWYGFANSLFGIVSLVSLAVLSYERYSTILSYTEPDLSDYKNAWLAIAVSWLYSLVWTVPPFFGWSSYGPEGPGTICSVQWQQRSFRNISYVTCLFIFCLLLPLLLMIIYYAKILFVIRGVGVRGLTTTKPSHSDFCNSFQSLAAANWKEWRPKEVLALGVTSEIYLLERMLRVAKINQLSAHRRETHVLVMVISMVSCYLLCWMPYGVVALLATFGQVGLVSPTTTIVISLLAKSSTFLNPIIYMLLNNQVTACHWHTERSTLCPATESLVLTATPLAHEEPDTSPDMRKPLDSRRTPL